MSRTSPYQIEIANRQRSVKIDRRDLTRLARRVLSVEQVASASISLAVVDDDEIHEINRNFLNHDFPTDVISFLLDVSPAPPAPSLAGSIRRGAGLNIEGEIVISADTAASNGRRLKTSTDHEIRLYLAHGLLHLCGYDDLTPKEKRIMRRREAEMLESQ